MCVCVQQKIYMRDEGDPSRSNKPRGNRVKRSELHHCPTELFASIGYWQYSSFVESDARGRNFRVPDFAVVVPETPKDAKKK
jgi:hypothetical protein